MNGTGYHPIVERRAPRIREGSQVTVVIKATEVLLATD
jgi:molybdopterin-binding protein